ncbi:MAG: tetratricopeptide repeat protein, partial [Xanthobacteraceae bacterium]
MAVFTAVSAEAATPADWDACERGYPPDKKIAACTKISNNPSETTPDRIKALIQRAFAHKFKNEYDAAYADIGAAIDLDPHQASTYDTRAFMFAGDGEIDRPIADYTAAINLEANGYRYLQRGDLYRKKGDLQHATADYKLAVAQYTTEMAAHPEFAGSYYGRSRAYRSLGDVDNALSDFNEFLRRKTDTVEASLADRADLYLRKGDFDRAIADYTQAIDQHPNFTDRYGKRALAYRLEGDYKRAILDTTRWSNRTTATPKSLSAGAWPMLGPGVRPGLAHRVGDRQQISYPGRAA